MPVGAARRLLFIAHAIYDSGDSHRDPSETYMGVCKNPKELSTAEFPVDTFNTTSDPGAVTSFVVWRSASEGTSVCL